jgi:RHS repeat-associated protein
MLLARTDAAGATAWYLTDHLGTVRDLADTAGTVIDHVAYDSFGRVTAETNPSAGDRFKFTGRELDTETGLQYHRARYYDAALGRWTQEDPIRSGGRKRTRLDLPAVMPTSIAMSAIRR